MNFEEYFDEMVSKKCNKVRNLLVEKNKAYGNSALDPIRIFSKSTSEEQILVRIDDKISRIARGDVNTKITEDTISDLIGYLILLQVSQDMKKNIVKVHGINN